MSLPPCKCRTKISSNFSLVAVKGPAVSLSTNTVISTVLQSSKSTRQGEYIEREREGGREREREYSRIGDTKMKQVRKNNASSIRVKKEKPHLPSPSLVSTSPQITSPQPHLPSPHLPSPPLPSSSLTSPHFPSPHLTFLHLPSPSLTSPFIQRQQL